MRISILSTFLVPLVALVALVALAASSGCHKGNSSPAASTAESTSSIGGCDHDVGVNGVAQHSWPYPAEFRDLRWGTTYKKRHLKLKPTQAAFITATVTWKEGDLITVEDSAVVIRKPRRLVAKRDLYVTRKVWDQGIEVERSILAVAEGEVGSFLFYNSRGMCMVGTEQGPSWTPCTLDDAFEGLSEENPTACEQFWWVKVAKSKVDRGWMVVEPGLMERVPPPIDAAK